MPADLEISGDAVRVTGGDLEVEASVRLRREGHQQSTWVQAGQIQLAAERPASAQLRLAAQDDDGGQLVSTLSAGHLTTRRVFATALSGSEVRGANRVETHELTVGNLEGGEGPTGTPGRVVVRSGEADTIIIDGAAGDVVLAEVGSLLQVIADLRARGAALEARG